MKKLIVILFILNAITCLPQILTIEISGIRKKEGVVQLMVYCDKTTFADETPFRVYTFDKTTLYDGKINAEITDLKPGIYGIVLIDDENRNGKIDYHLFVPHEGFGFSNYQFKGRCKPSFNSFAFQFTETKNIKIKVQYF